MPLNTNVVIIGAGPYGLSVAAHLRFFGVDFRIFGSSMHRWLHQMPKNMFLKSEGCASSLPDPTGHYTLRRYCGNEGLPFAEYGSPVPRDVLVRYALFYQKKLVPNVEDVMVNAVSRRDHSFELTLSTGETLNTGTVIVATGLDHMTYVPGQFAGLPTELWSHTAGHHDLSGFKGKEVAVVGGGQSGLETAAILCEEGASVNLLVRRPNLAWNPVPSKMQRSRYRRFRSPRTRLGDGLQLWVYDNAPGVFHHLPRRIRLTKVKETLGPAGAWWLQDRVVGQLPILLGHHVCEAKAKGGRVALQVIDQEQRARELMTDHVILGTGYRFDVDKLPFLDQNLKLQLRREQQSPLLSANFESSVPGLYFTGLGSVNSFGPVMRFLAGTGYTARRISNHVAARHRVRIRRSVPLEGCWEF